MSENSLRTPKKFQDFYGRDFLVSPDVLVPRPETEQMIDMVLSLSGRAYLPGMASPARILPEQPVILDIGTGSGCIATTVALEIPEAKVYALDISLEALKVARENARRLLADVKFMQSDLLGSYGGPEPDLILANLPYVDKNWEWVDTEALSSEPEIALYAEDGGLELIKELFVQISSAERSPQLILEADPCQHEAIIKYAKKRGFRHEETRGFILRFTRNICPE